MSETETGYQERHAATVAALAAARTELSHLRRVVEAVQAGFEALAAEWDTRAQAFAGTGIGDAYANAASFTRARLRAALAPVSSSGEAGCPDCGGSGVVQEAHDGGTHPVHCRCTYAAPSSGEAESGEHDDRCEADFIVGPMAYSPCGCARRAAEGDPS